MNPHNNEYLHTVISGPPGVGKTELAKLYGKIFAKLGILKTDKFVEIKRSDLVGEYLGHTAPKTKRLLESAMGGVLFLDEAYSLGNSDKKDSFSKEAIDLLNMYLSERKGEFMFIIAGYEDDIEDCLFSHNKGMKRRFQSYYNIKPYNSKELMEIFLLKLKESNYYTNIKNDLDEFFIENKNSFQYYGGDIEKLINEIKYVQCYRVFKSGITSREVLLTDIKEGFKNMKIKEKENNMMYL
jgi:SpoVK/Ycf46/Vps4 family AAA+-type ATPase